MPFDLLAVGDIAIDLFMKISDASVSCDINHEHCKICFDYADKVHVEKLEASMAGNGPNVAVGCAKLGLNSALYCELGDDSNADFCLKTLKENNVDTRFCLKSPGTPTDIHPIVVFKGERTIFSYHRKKDYHLQNWGSPKILYYTSLSEGFEKFQAELTDYLNANPSIMVAVNPGTTQMRMGVEAQRNILSATDILFVNKQEAEALTEGENLLLESLHEKLQDLGPKLTVITDAENGSSAFDGKDLVHQEAVEVKKIVDMTGAGDAFASGFISAIHYGRSMQEALRWGAENAAGTIQEIGAIHGLLGKKDLF